MGVVIRSRTTAALVAIGSAIAMPSAASAQLPIGPLNDLAALGQGAGQRVVAVPAMTRAEPALAATPVDPCGPGARPQPSIDGRVPAGTATRGLWCNASLVSHHGQTGGFRVWRYTDDAGHRCAFYDTTLLAPANALRLDSSSLGVAVLDMSDPAHPAQTASLVDPAMLSPHESLNLNVKRGLLVAVSGNPDAAPGYVSIYDAHADCRHPVNTYQGVLARLGHESGFSPDGLTFYATSSNFDSVTAIDVADPHAPHVVWQGQLYAHGMSLSDDGRRAYVADPVDGALLILDTSQVQERRPDPQVREISRLTWRSVSVPQDAIPFTRRGHPYLLEIDEYNAGNRQGPAATPRTGADADDVGAARIIDIADETQPRVVANLRLAVHQHDAHAAYGSDPGSASPVQGYAGHYCNVSAHVDPSFVACSFIASGLRIFNIRDVRHPTEAGYFVAPTRATAENLGQASNFAMSQPAFDLARHQVWYTDGSTGFYAIRIDDAAWAAAQTPASCSGKRRFTATLTLPRGARVRSVTATLGGRRISVHRSGRRIRAVVDLRGATRRVVRLVIRARLRNQEVVSTTRVYHPCRRRSGR